MRGNLRIVLFLVLSLLILVNKPSLVAQTITGTSFPDSVMEKRHSPTKATLMSACLPGLGQIYNKKYWKVPIIYVGFGVMTYFIVFNGQYYNTFKNAYIAALNKDTTGEYSDLVRKYTAQDLISARDYYRRNLEISCLLTALWYVLNILDATVDAHLFTYNINKELSLKIEPAWMGPANSRNIASGLRISFKF